MSKNTEICVEILDETSNAYFVTDGDKIQVWIPKSQITDMFGEDNCYTMNIPEWLALKKGLI